jgi:hypothetical protein
MAKNLYFLLIAFACFFCVGCCAFSFAERKLHQSGNIIVKNRLRFGDSKLHETQLSNDETVKIAIRRGYWTSDLYFRFNVNKGCFFYQAKMGNLHSCQTKSQLTSPMKMIPCLYVTEHSGVMIAFMEFMSKDINATSQYCQRQNYILGQLIFYLI